MRLIEQTRLWRSTLAEQGKRSSKDDSDPEERGILRGAFKAFRDRASLLASEIPQDLKELAVHDTSHTNALWEIADTILGDEYDSNRSHPGDQ